MLLKDLLRQVPTKRVIGSIEVQIKGIAYDSREVKAGYLFVCLPGTKTDGHEFIGDSVSRGAVAVVVSRNMERLANCTIIEVFDVRRALSRISAIFFQEPSRSLRLIGVTGTNGKTTTTYLIDKLVQAKEKKVTGLIGTIGHEIDQRSRPAQATTPEAATLHKLFKEMVDSKVTYCTMEVSSHALALCRVDDCDFNVAVLTNITADHLYFHKNISSYRQAKAKLFLNLAKKEGNYVVINNDDENAFYIKKIASSEIVTYGIKTTADISAQNIHITSSGLFFSVHSRQGEFPLTLKITGIFNVYNALAAIAVGLKENIPMQVIKRVLERFPGLPGRFEKIEAGQDFTVIIDYAHNPDGLENTLAAARRLCQGNLITVFGCSGDREGKTRSHIGSIAMKYSDYAVITNDNPLSEEPDKILADILAGIDNTIFQGKYDTIPDRAEAIKAAIYRAKAADVVLIAGKGHETSQVFAGRTIDFDDREIARRYLLKRQELGKDSR